MEPPPVTPQVTVAGVSPVTVAVYCCVPPRGRFTYPGEIVTVWACKQPPARSAAPQSAPIRLANPLIKDSLRCFGDKPRHLRARSGPSSALADSSRRTPVVPGAILPIVICGNHGG